MTSGTANYRARTGAAVSGLVIRIAAWIPAFGPGKI